MFHRISALLILFITLTSFSGVDSSLLHGVWVPNGKGKLVWSETIPSDSRCYIFKGDGTLTVRQNVGWCGTPPITYGNYSGTWDKNTKNGLILKYSYWGGDIEEVWIITSLKEDEMQYLSVSYKTIDQQK